MHVAFTVSPLRTVHDVIVASKKKRSFMIDIYEAAGAYASIVTVHDRISTNQGSWQFSVTPATPSATDNFKAAIELIVQYLDTVDKTDAIADVHNPCNCPFVPAKDQDRILGQLGLPLTVRVN